MLDLELKTIRVFSGAETVVNLLKAELSNINVPSIIKNNFNSGVIAGISGGLPTAVDLYIYEKHLEKAEPIIQDYMERNG